MNIVFLVGRIEYGGGEKVRNWLANRLVKSGHNVSYYVPDYLANVKEQFLKAGLDDNIKIRKIPTHIKKKFPISYIYQLYGFFCEDKIDLFVIFGGSLVEQLVAKLCGVKILLSERVDPTSRPFLSRILKKVQYMIANGYVFQTKEASLCYGKRAARIGVIIPNPIIDHLPDPLPPNRKEIVTVGRLSRQKNQKLLIEAFSRFYTNHPDYKLIIYGSGPLKSDLLKLSEQLNLSNVVSIIEGQKRVVDLINGATLFVLPSIYEGMPNALIEAMAMGIVCISTDCPIYGSRMLIDNYRNGFLTTINDVNSMVEKMEMALLIDTVKIREESVKIRERLNPDLIFDCWKQYFDKIANDIK